jgi:quercetin dioxygenase-like cupin family protein
MPFFKWKELEAELITPKYSPARGPFVQGEVILMGMFSYPAGGKAEPHTHPNEQIVSIIKGKGWMRIGDEEREVGPGDVVLIPANTEHGGEVYEDQEVIVCKNVVPNWSLKEGDWEK